MFPECLGLVDDNRRVLGSINKWNIVYLDIIFGLKWMDVNTSEGCDEWRIVEAIVSWYEQDLEVSNAIFNTEHVKYILLNTCELSMALLDSSESEMIQRKI
jgi:hypothetical protein